VLDARPCPQIRAALADELQCECRTQPMDLCHVEAEHAIQRGPNIEGGRVNLFGLDAQLGELSDPLSC
jgi:hypothetical protein